MAKVMFPDFIAIPNQIQVQRQNFIGICRLVVKTLTDNVNILQIDEGSQDLQNLFAILEQIFSHRLKPIINWYGGVEPRYFWDFIQTACTRVQRNCLSTIETMNQPMTPIGKGRAWIRMCLMEKRLTDYVLVALQSLKTLEGFYEDGSIMLCEESSILPDILLGLNIIDFSFDIKGTYLDFPWFLAINYSKYLKFSLQSNVTNKFTKAEEEPGLSCVVQSGDDEYANEMDDLKITSTKLTDQLRVTTEQKRYLDELLRLRELQIEDLSIERKKISEVIENDTKERKKEKVQFESIIFELQSQLFHLRQHNKGLAKKLQSKAKKESENSHAGVLMSHLLIREGRDDNRNESETGERLGMSISAQIEMAIEQTYRDDAKENRDMKKKNTAADHDQPYKDKDEVIQIDLGGVEIKNNLDEIVKA